MPEMESPLFFENPIQYNLHRHANSKNQPDKHIHHDGQLERIAEVNNLFSLKPDQARTMHVGVGGQHDIGSDYKITGTLEEKTKQYYDLINKGSIELRKYVTNFKKDIVVTNFDNPIFTKLTLDTNRNLAKASSWWYDKTNEFKKYIDENI